MSTGDNKAINKLTELSDNQLEDVVGGNNPDTGGENRLGECDPDAERVQQILKEAREQQQQAEAAGITDVDVEVKPLTGPRG